MPSKVTIPNTFATATTAIPLSQLDANFSNVNAAINNALTFSNYALDAGTANTYSVSITGQTTTYAAGLAIQFLALNTNTGASTLNVNAQGAKTIVNTSGAALTAGAITAGAIVSVMYDGTNFQLLNDAGTQSETFLNLTVTGTTNTANLIVTQTGATFAAGSNTAPAITTTGDTNTGIFFPAADTIAFTEGGAEAMRIDSSGQLLLNTTSALTNVYFEASNITPTTQFITNQTASYSGGLALINYSAGGFGSVLTIGSSRSDTKGTNTTTSNGTPVAQLNFVGNDGTNFRTTAAIKVAIDGVSGSGDMPGRLEFYTTADGAATATERMRIDSSGRLGIGTSSPNATLHVQGSGTTDGSIVFNQQLTATTAYNSSPQSGSMVSLKYNTGGDFAGMGGWSIIKENGTDGNFAGAMLFHTRANGGAITERMRISSSGNVGIGTSSPNAKLQINVGGSGGSVINFDGYNAFGWSDSDHLNIGGITSSQWQVLKMYTGGSERARITAGGYFKASNNGTYDNSTGTYHEFTGNAASNSALFIYNSNASFTNYVTEIYSNRNTTNATYYFLRCRVASVGDRLYIADSGNVTNVNGSYGTISDVKLKQDITDATSQWNDIKNLRFRKYRLKSEVEVNPDAKSLLGLVAQEAELVSPGLIEEHKDLEEIQVPVLDEDGNPVLDEEGNPKTEKQSRPTGTTTKSIKTSILYMKAVKALQEAMTRIEALEAEVAALKGN